MKRKILIYILICTLCITTFTYKVFADNILSILTINKINNINEDIIIKVNLDSIEYNSFKFVLSSDDTIESIDTDTDIDIVNNNNNEISFEYDKINSNINDITLSYKISNNHKKDDKITFNVKIINLENIEEYREETYEVVLTENEDTSNIESNTNSDITSNKPSKNEEINTSPSNINTNNTSNKNNMPSNTNKDILSISTKKTTNTKQVVQSIPTTKVTTSYTSVPTTSSKPKVTYNGSNNNYLTNISIKGYELNKEFKKESNTYFITVDSDTTSISITTSKDDSTSSVSITGNDNLTTGLNKVLINVTAENGNIRTYRIYVTKESE